MSPERCGRHKTCNILYHSIQATGSKPFAGLARNIFYHWMSMKKRNGGPDLHWIWGQNWKKLFCAWISHQICDTCQAAVMVGHSGHGWPFWLWLAILVMVAHSGYGCPFWSWLAILVMVDHSGHGWTFWSWLTILVMVGHSGYGWPFWLWLVILLWLAIVTVGQRVVGTQCDKLDPCNSQSAVYTQSPCCPYPLGPVDI